MMAPRSARKHMSTVRASSLAMAAPVSALDAASISSIRRRHAALLLLETFGRHGTRPLHLHPVAASNPLLVKAINPLRHQAFKLQRKDNTVIQALPLGLIKLAYHEHARRRRIEELVQARFPIQIRDLRDVVAVSTSRSKTQSTTGSQPLYQLRRFARACSLSK